MLALVLALNIHAQDSIVNYLDNKGKTIKKEQATEIETIVKKDSLWLVTKYFRNGKIKKIGYFNTKDKKKPVGEFVTYHKNGQVSSLVSYNEYSKKDGLNQSWFANGELSHKGIYLNDKKEGLWRYYHYNNVEACRIFHENDSILKSVIFDEHGKQLDVDLIEKRKPEYKGGIKNFYSKIKVMNKAIDYKLKGIIYIDFVLDVYGNIEEVAINEKLPNNLNEQIVSFFEAIEGWKPAVHMNRKIPYNFSIPINFKSR